MRSISRLAVAVLGAAALTVLFPSVGLAQSAVKVSGEGTLMEVPSGPSILDLGGTASHLGLFACHGEITFERNADENGIRHGHGVAIFTAANGDRLAAFVTYDERPDGTAGTHFAWRDAVQFNDGTTYYSTGRFETQRPAGLITDVKFYCTIIFGYRVCIIDYRG